MLEGFRLLVFQSSGITRCPKDNLFDPSIGAVPRILALGLLCCSWPLPLLAPARSIAAAEKTGRRTGASHNRDSEFYRLSQLGSCFVLGAYTIGHGNNGVDGQQR